MSNIAIALERCIEECDPYLAHLLKYFRYDHLPDRLQFISGPFCSLAIQMVDKQKHALDGPEATAMLRKLLEAKDCAVRAAL
jgi:hypothetical protein